MSNNMNNSNDKDNNKWSDQNAKRYREDNKSSYNDYSDVSSIGKQHFAPQISHPQIPLSRSSESIQEGIYSQTNDINKSMMPSEDKEVTDAMAFLNRIKEEFADDMVTYDNFLETMRDYKFGKIDADEVCKGVRILFKDKQHLIEIFNEYLPRNMQLNLDNKNNDNMNKMYDKMQMHNQHPPQFRRPMYNPKMMQPGMNPNLRPMMPKIGPPHHYGPQPHMSSGLIPGMIPGFAPPPNMQHMNPMPHIRLQPPPNKFNSGIYNFNLASKSFEDYGKKKQANDYIQRVKKRYANQPGVYKTFVDILQKFSPDANIASIRAEVASLLWEHPDLIEDFEKNFISSEKIKMQEEETALKKLCKRMEDKAVLDDFLRSLNYYNQKFITKKDLLFLVTPILKDSELIESFKELIKYKEKPDVQQSKILEKCKKIGSYRILNQEIENLNQDAIAKEVVNTTCVSCPTFESEETNFVFLKRNSYEDAIFRVEDDRSEATLIIERLDCLIIALENCLSNLKDNEISIKDLGMSPGIIKEILKSVYEDQATEVLENVLSNPKVAIPVLIKRLYSVMKETREKIRQKHKVWNEQVERSYYKALDINGTQYKNTEKMYFATKYLYQELENGFTQEISDLELIKEIIRIFNIFIRISQADNKKAAIPNLYPTVDLVFETIFKNTSFIGDYNIFCAYRFIFYVYEKLKILKDLKLKPIKTSELAIKINITSRYDVEDRFQEILNVIQQYIEKSIDQLDFEETIRILTDCKGYIIYNIKKVFLKIEKAIIAILDDEVSLNQLKTLSKEAIPEESIKISFKDNIFKAAIIQDDSNHQIYLKKSLKEKSTSGVILSDLELAVNEDNIMRPVENTEFLYISQDNNRNTRKNKQ